MCTTQFRLFWLLFAVVLAAAKECDKNQCKGPINYYEDLNCKPIYEKEGDCCAIRYDCSHLNERSMDMCYVNGKAYAIGEPLKEEDSRPCDIGCTCVRGYNNVAVFNCAVVDCFHGPAKLGCYFKQSLNTCCPGEEVCPEDDESTCEVDGKTYRLGQAFYPSQDPELSCECMEGYKDENVPPFCAKIPITTYCRQEFRHAFEIRENCAPVYYASQSPITSCNVLYRCQNNNDTVIHAGSERSGKKVDKSNSKENNEDMMCKFGNMMMQIGDELNQATDYSSVCVKCVCEVPPTPTCKRLPDSECDVTNHPQFQL